VRENEKENEREKEKEKGRERERERGSLVMGHGRKDVLRHMGLKPDGKWQSLPRMASARHSIRSTGMRAPHMRKVSDKVSRACSPKIGRIVDRA
jgi:hypothetical protein